MDEPLDNFLAFCQVCEDIKSTRSKLKKVNILDRYLRKLDEKSLQITSRYLSGLIFPKWSGQEVFVGYSALVRLVMEITGSTEKEMSKFYVKYGDLGETASELFSNKSILPLMTIPLTISNIHLAFERMSRETGYGAVKERRKILKGLLLDCTPFEAKYLIKILVNELRIGLNEGLVEEAIASAFRSGVEDVRNALLITADIGLTAALALKKKLSDARIEPLHPTNFMLADPMKTPEEVETYYKRNLFAEYKYDGVRTQLHRKGGSVKLFSRRLEDISKSFPEIIALGEKINGDYILDGELLGFSEQGPIGFQELQHRLRKKMPAKELQERIPVRYFAFDILFYNGRQLIDEPLQKRKDFLRGLELRGQISMADHFVVEKAPEIAKLFEESKRLGFEGLVLKEPSSPYTPGRRGRAWIKLKKELDTLDVVIVAAEYGHGKRAGVLSDYTFAVREEDGLRVVGKAYSGVTDEEILQLTSRLKELMIRDEGYRIIVKPQIVLEVAFDGIQRSDRHDSGYALRFPRIKRIRDDKGPDQIDVLDRIEQIFRRSGSFG